MADDKPCPGCALLVEHERELREAWQAAHDAARGKRDVVLDRRLEDLNGHAERLEKERYRFVSAEKYDEFLKLYDSKHEALVQRIGLEHEARVRMEAAVNGARQLIAVVGSPGVLALLWALIAAAAGKTVTGPGGLLP